MKRFKRNRDGSASPDDCGNQLKKPKLLTSSSSDWLDSSVEAVTELSKLIPFVLVLDVGRRASVDRIVVERGDAARRLCADADRPIFDDLFASWDSLRLGAGTCLEFCALSSLSRDGRRP